MRPFLKFMVPDASVHEKEKEIWDKIRNSSRITSNMPSETFDALSKLRDSNVNLSSRSVSFLCLEHEQELMTFMHVVFEHENFNRVSISQEYHCDH